jgi:hypothetical protein
MTDHGSSEQGTPLTGKINTVERRDESQANRALELKPTDRTRLNGAGQ